MKIRLTSRGYLGLLAGLAGAAIYLMTGSAVPEPKPEPKPEPQFAPSESIDVEHTVDFPYDI